jgi:hypothetical protein
MNVVQKADYLLQQFRAIVEENNEDERVLKDAMLFAFYLPQADYYEISKDIFSFAESMVPRREDNLTYPEDLKLDHDAKAPSEACALSIEGWDDALIFVYKTNKDMERYHVHYLAMVEQDGQKGVHVGRLGGYTLDPFNESGDHVFVHPDNEDRDDEFKQNLGLLIFQVASCFTIINQPRFVIQSPAATRQQRKYMLKARKIPTGAWKKIEWNIAEPVYAHNESKQGGWNLPLHYKRGHWRKAEAHWDDIVIRKDGKPYKWIEGYWAGHPAFGIQRSYHAPKLGGKYETIHA